MPQVENGSDPESMQCNITCGSYCASACALGCLLDPSPIADVALSFSFGISEAYTWEEYYG